MYVIARSAPSSWNALAQPHAIECSFAIPTTSALRPLSTGRGMSIVIADVLSCGAEDAPCVARDHQLFVRGDRPRRDTAARLAEAWTTGVVGGGVELHAEPLRVAAHPLAQARTVLADAGGEHDRVETPERRGERAQLAADPIDEEIDRGLRRRFRARLERAHVARDAGHAEQPGLLVDQLLDRARVHLELVHQIEHHTRIEIAAARAHRQTVG